MKKLPFSQGLVTLAVCLCAATLSASAEEVKKDFHREMVPGTNTTLTVLNKFGDVVTETWAQNNIVVDVIVTVEHPSAEKAKKILDMIDVKFTEADGNLTAETVFKEDFSNRSWGKDGNKFSIDYSIKMPAKINLTVNNRYGNSDIDEVAGLASLEVKYGNLTVHKLTRGNVKPLNSLVVAYGKATVDEVSWAEVNARYCGQFSITKATALLMDTRYSKISIGAVSSLVCDSKYDGYNVEEAANIIAMSGYTNLSFQSVNKKLEVETKYGNLSVDRVPAGFEMIKVKAGYCSVRLGIESGACYTLDANSSYGSVKVDDGTFSPDKRIIGNTSSELAGKVGKCANPQSSIAITISYGSAKLY
ncbi:MAG TPA: hypothetical protein VMV74_09220 [Bacteroidales bacterium]|nr:hypothetical protein [Bacteroidales bacterium]